MGKQSREKWQKREERGSEASSKSGVQFGLSRTETKFPVRGLEKTCLFIIKWGTYLVLFIPLIINTNFFFPFVAPKTIFFRIIIEIILLAYLLLVMKNRAYRPRINPLTIAVSLFLAIFILTSFTGINLHRSFWSTNERMTGIFTMLHLFAFFIVLTSVFKERKDWERVLGVSVIVGVILSFYILMGKELSTRGGGTIGNTSFMAAYLLFDVFFALILFFSNFLKKGSRSLPGQIFLSTVVFLPAFLIVLAIGWPLWGQILLGIVLFIPALFIERAFRKGDCSFSWQIFSGISLGVMLPVLFYSSARGATGSFWGGLLLLGLGYLIFSRKKVLQRIALSVILVLLILVIASAVFQPPIVKEGVENLLNYMSPRFAVWATGWKGFLERPILGWGPENFIVVFNKYFNPCMFSSCGGEIWFDRVHNIFLDTLVTTGLVGLLSYLAIFGVAIYGLLRSIPKIIERRHIFFPLGLSVLLLGYFFQNLFVFDMINTYLVFFLSLGLIGFLTQHQPVEEKEFGSRRVNPVFGSLIVIIAILILWLGNIQPLMANHYLIKTMSSQEVGQASLFFHKSLDSWMEKYEPREYFAQKMMAAVDSSVEGEARKEFQAAFDLAEVEMKKSVEENSLDFRPRLFLGELYLRSYRFSGDSEKVNQAEKTLIQAIGLSPTNQQGYWNLAEVKLAQGQIAETIKLFKKAVELEPGVGSSHWYLASAYKIAGQNELAKEEVILAKKFGYNWLGNITDLNRVIEIYNTLGDDESLLSLYLQAVELSPQDAQVWAGLAATYANLGQFEKAIEAAQKIIEIDPQQASQVQNFLKNLPQQ